jgi:hypothetical protein
MLRELEEDPFGVSSLELDRLLEAWGCTSLLPDREMFGYRTYQHERAPGFVLHYPRKAELGPATVRNICAAVHILSRRISA